MQHAGRKFYRNAHKKYFPTMKWVKYVQHLKLHPIGKYIIFHYSYTFYLNNLILYFYVSTKAFKIFEKC